MADERRGSILQTPLPAADAWTRQRYSPGDAGCFPFSRLFQTSPNIARKGGRNALLVCLRKIIRPLCPRALRGIFPRYIRMPCRQRSRRGEVGFKNICREIGGKIFPYLPILKIKIGSKDIHAENVKNVNKDITIISNSCSRLMIQK